jgi:hypothetical protein
MDGYAARRTVFETESTFRIEAGALVREIGRAEAQRTSLAEVRRVALSYQPLTLFDRWVCSVEGAGGRIWIPSASFTGPGQAADRRQSFRPFVAALCAAIAAQPSGPSIVYVKGSDWSAYGALAMLIVMAIMGLLLALGVVGALLDRGGLGGASWAILPIVVVLWAARMVWRVWRRNRRHAFDPTALPPDFAV